MAQRQGPRGQPGSLLATPRGRPPAGAPEGAKTAENGQKCPKSRKMAFLGIFGDFGHFCPFLGFSAVPGEGFYINPSRRGPRSPFLAVLESWARGGPGRPILGLFPGNPRKSGILASQAPWALPAAPYRGAPGAPERGLWSRRGYPPRRGVGGGVPWATARRERAGAARRVEVYQGSRGWTI